MKIAWRRIPARASLVFGLFASCLTLAFSSPAWADTFTATNTDDSGQGSLRDAIDRANSTAGVDTVNASGIGGTVDLNSSLQPTGEVVILGPGAEDLTIDGNGATVFAIFSSEADITIADLTVTGAARLANETGGASSRTAT